MHDKCRRKDRNKGRKCFKRTLRLLKICKAEYRTRINHEILEEIGGKPIVSNGATKQFWARYRLSGLFTHQNRTLVQEQLTFILLQLFIINLFFNTK